MVKPNRTRENSHEAIRTGQSKWEKTSLLGGMTTFRAPFAQQKGGEGNTRSLAACSVSPRSAATRPLGHKAREESGCSLRRLVPVLLQRGDLLLPLFDALHALAVLGR